MTNITQLITANIYRLGFGMVASYIIGGGDNYIAIDAGTSAAKLMLNAAALGIPLEKVTHCFLTHSDYDHVSGAAAFPNAKLYISVDEVPMITGRGAKGLHRLTRSSLKKANYETLSPLQTFDTPSCTIKCIPTPGHTPGSISFLLNDIYLFTGDALSLKRGKAGIFKPLMNMNTESCIGSICDIAAITAAKWLFTAHDGYTDDAAAALENWRDDTENNGK